MFFLQSYFSIDENMFLTLIFFMYCDYFSKYTLNVVGSKFSFKRMYNSYL